MTDLSEFLLARIAEDEHWANEARGHVVDVSVSLDGAAAMTHISRWSSSRVLAECDAKRHLLSWHRQNTYGEDGEPHGPEDECPAWRLLAAPYSDHPDYQQEWKP